MLAENLLKGIAVVIDDEVEEEYSEIAKIITQISERNVPVLKYSSPPEDQVVKNFRGVSFIILDWLFSTPGTPVSKEVQAANVAKNIHFLKEICKTCFCPVFIFTGDDLATITATLKRESIIPEDYNDETHNILIKDKNSLIGQNSLFDTLNRWIRTNPSVYVLKKWEDKLESAKTTFFSSFQNSCTHWPKIMWSTYGDDGVDKGHELSELIMRNIQTRITPIDFDDTLLSSNANASSATELRKIIEQSHFVSNTHLNANNIAPGDIFVDGSKYFLNIRAACDCINRNNQDIMLYLIRGNKLTIPKTTTCFRPPYGFTESDNYSIVFPINDRAIEFRFKNLELKDWNEFKTKRIGRLLPPHITKIQQKYAHYMHRQGLPKIPVEAINYS